MTSQRTRDRLVERLRRKGIRDERVLEVMRKVPRHLFIDEAMASRAYEDTALPVGQGQTISQPFVVARMTEALLHQRRPGSVLEVGTGSGYQAAVLSQLFDRVYTLERIQALLVRARQRFKLLHYRNILLRHADGGRGWRKHAPFDAIMVTAAPRDVPEELLAQLAIGGRMVLPLGGQDGSQELVVVKREAQVCVQETLHSVSFVPFLNGRI
jgi:protein-L-isoaspartate(D-aspartate) O-methyltransferase